MQHALAAVDMDFHVQLEVYVRFRGGAGGSLAAAGGGGGGLALATRTPRTAARDNIISKRLSLYLII